MSKLEVAEAKRVVVEQLLALEEAKRLPWLQKQDQKFIMYKHYNTEELT